MGINSSERDEKYEVNRWIAGMERERERKGHTRVCVSAIRIINQLGREIDAHADRYNTISNSSSILPTHPPVTQYSADSTGGVSRAHTLSLVEFKTVVREAFCELYTLPRIVVQLQSSLQTLCARVAQGRKRSVAEAAAAACRGFVTRCRNHLYQLPANRDRVRVTKFPGYTDAAVILYVQYIYTNYICKTYYTAYNCARSRTPIIYRTSENRLNYAGLFSLPPLTTN